MKSEKKLGTKEIRDKHYFLDRIEVL